MKSAVSLVALCAPVLVFSSPLSKFHTNVATRGADGSPSTSFASTHGTTFDLDGKRQYFAGTNSWWLGHLFEDADVEIAVSEIVKSGLKVSRVWGFGNVNTPTNESVYYQLLDNSTSKVSINYGSNGIGRLDSAIRHAEKYGLKLVLPMLNNWDDLGGISTYCAYANSTTTGKGCTATSFFTNQVAQTAYKNYIKFLVSRYKQSPAVFAWELCNEPRCHGCDKSVIHNWASQTSAYIKSLDSKHLVTLGDEGWFCNDTYPGNFGGSYAYSCGEGVDFALNLQIPTLDYGTFHMYPDQWGYNYTWGNEWISQHAQYAKIAGKPVVLEEYGAPNNQANQTAIDAEWQQTILQSNIAYDSFWQFGTTLPSGTNDTDQYTVSVLIF